MQFGKSIRPQGQIPSGENIQERNIWNNGFCPKFYHLARGPLLAVGEATDLFCHSAIKIQMQGNSLVSICFSWPGSALQAVIKRCGGDIIDFMIHHRAINSPFGRHRRSNVGRSSSSTILKRPGVSCPPGRVLWHPCLTESHRCR